MSSTRLFSTGAIISPVGRSMLFPLFILHRLVSGPHRLTCCCCCTARTPFSSDPASQRPPPRRIKRGVRPSSAEEKTKSAQCQSLFHSHCTRQRVQEQMAEQEEYASVVVVAPVCALLGEQVLCWTVPLYIFSIFTTLTVHFVQRNALSCDRKALDFVVDVAVL
jgi:hypothetical protein